MEAKKFITLMIGILIPLTISAQYHTVSSFQQVFGYENGGGYIKGDTTKSKIALQRLERRYIKKLEKKFRYEGWKFPHTVCLGLDEEIRTIRTYAYMKDEDGKAVYQLASCSVYGANYDEAYEKAFSLANNYLEMDINKYLTSLTGNMEPINIKIEKDLKNGRLSSFIRRNDKEKKHIAVDILARIYRHIDNDKTEAMASLMVKMEDIEKFVEETSSLK